MAGRAALTCFIVMPLFSFAGNFIFSLFGITLPAFKIAGGIILGLISLDMVQARRSPTKALKRRPETRERASRKRTHVLFRSAYRCWPNPVPSRPQRFLYLKPRTGSTARSSSLQSC